MGRKLDYVFCLPGDPSSAGQSIQLHRMLNELNAEGKTFVVIPQKATNIYQVRNYCLSPPRESGSDSQPFLGYDFRADQKPFETVVDDYERIIWIDSDNIVNSAVVKKLLSYDVDMVAAWYKLLLHGSDPQRISAGFGTKPPFKCLLSSDLPMWPRTKDGLIEVDWSGFGLMIVKKGVTESLGYPWFYGEKMEWEEDGVKMARVVEDDEGFCMRAKAKGFKIFIAPECKVAHEKKVAI